jgi:hypothetical protein
MPEIRSGHTGSDARADQRVPRISGPSIPGAGRERGRSLAGGAHGSTTQTIGRGKQRGPDRRVTERPGPLVSDGGHAQARHRRHALTDGALQAVTQNRGKG